MSTDQRETDIALVADFVRRLRRVALHPLALSEGSGEDAVMAMPGDLLRTLMGVEISAQLRSDGTATIRWQLPDEVQFESLATRVRAFTLTRDRLYWPNALDAIDRLTGLEDVAIRLSSRQLRQEWTEATDRTASRTRAYISSYATAEVVAGGAGDQGQFSDIDLAYAWLYQDVAHGDEVSTGRFDVAERYHAAVGVFSHIAVVVIETLHYINELVELGVIGLPVGTFSDPVIVTATEFVWEGKMYQSEVGADLGDALLGGPLPDHFRPAFDLIHELHQQNAEPAAE
jgi:hypothetical protein